MHLSLPLRRGPRGLLPCLALFLAAAAQAQSVVVITGSREPLAPERLAADVAVIAADAVRLGSADSLADLLRREAGVQLSRNGGPGHSSGMLLRGTASSNNVVLVDGMRIGSATLGFASFESLALAQVERVEVLRGPGSSLYGADAVGGVVNIITRRGSPGLQVDGRIAVGGYGAREASAGVAGAAGAWDAALSLSSERSRGVSALRPGDLFGNYNPDTDGHRLDAANAAIGFKPAPGHRIGLTLLRSRLDSFYDGSEFLPPSFAADPSPNFRNRLDTEVAQLEWRGALAPGLNVTASAGRSVDASVDGGTQPDRFRTQRERLAAQLAWQTGVVGQLVLALERNEDQARSTSFAAEVQRRNDAAVVELTGHAGAWSWQADMRRDDASDTGDITTTRLGGTVTLIPGLRLRALTGSTFRAPTFNDLYFPGFGVSSLRPERGRSTEIGLDWTHATGSLSATTYANRVHDLIGFESDRSRCPADPSYDFGCAANTRVAEILGATVTASQRLGALTLKAQHDLLRAIDRDSGQRLPRRAAHQLSLGADWTVGDWTLGARGLRVGERPDLGKMLAAENTLDLIATWRVAPQWTLQAKLINATDVDLEPSRDYQGLGRQAWLSLRYEMK